MIDRLLLGAAIVLAAILWALIGAQGPLTTDTHPVSITKENHP